MKSTIPMLPDPSRQASPTPLVSIVIPVYNGAKYIEECLRSVQVAVTRLGVENRACVEIVLCDNHSTDGTYDLAKATEFLCSYRVIQPPQHYENRTKNWHCGLSAARGVWMMMLHVDDLLAAEGIQVALAACRNPASATAAIIAGRHQLFSEDTPPGRQHPIWPFPALIAGNAMREQALPLECAFIPTTLMRKETYQRIGGLDSRYQLVQDWDLWIRLAAMGDVFYTPHQIGLWRQHGYPEKWAYIFAVEHCALLCDLRRLVPDLPLTTLNAAIDAHMPRVMTWAPKTTLDEIVADIPSNELILRRPRLVPEERDRAMKRRLSLINRRLLSVRFQGTLRLLFQRPPHTGGTHPLSSSADPASKSGSQP